MATLSRSDNAIIVSGEWVEDPQDKGLIWWTVTTDKTEGHAFRTIGVGRGDEANLRDRYSVGDSIRLGDLAFAPVPNGLLVFFESAEGPVLAGIGRVRDQLERFCGPVAYLVPRSKTRTDTVDPSTRQLSALRSALRTLMTDGTEAAKKELEAADVFDNVWWDVSACPVAPSKLTGGAFEWRR